MVERVRWRKRRLKGGGSQDWLPNIPGQYIISKTAHPCGVRLSACRRLLAGVLRNCRKTPGRSHPAG